MSHSKRCCVPGCSNTFASTKYTVAYFRFPKDKEVRQKWLDAINWSNGRPKPNHYVCGVHFDSIDMTSLLDGNTTAVPTIFNPEFVTIKQENDISDPNLSTLSSNNVLDTEIIKVEIDDHSNALDFESYEIINIPTAPADEIEMPLPKRIKIENNSSDSSSEPQEAPQNVNVTKNDKIEMPLPIRIKIENNSSDSSSEPQEGPQNVNVTKNDKIEMPLPIRIKIENNSSDSSSDPQGANQSTSIEMSESKVTKVDISKVSLKLVSGPSDQDSKMIVNAVAKSSEKQSNSSYDALVKPSQIKLPIYGAKSVLKVKTKAPERQSIRIHVGKSLLKPQIKSPEDQSSSSYAIEPEVTLTKSSEHQTKPITAKIVDEGMVKSSAESSSCPTACAAETDSISLSPNSGLNEAETRDLLNYMLIHRNEYLNLNKLPRSQSKFWETAELCLKKQGVIRQSITKDILCNKWNVLSGAFRRLTQYEIDQNKFPFTKELKEILQGPVKGPNVPLGPVKGPNVTLEHDNKLIRPRFNSEHTSLTVNSSKVYNHYQWTENDTREFLKCISKHKEDFVDWANGKQRNFWEKIEVALKEQDIMIKIATAEKLIEKWNVLLNTYRYFPSGEVDRSKFPFIEEMKEILLDSLKSHNHSISIGLASLCQTVKSPSEIDFETQMPLNHPTYKDKLSSNNKKILSMSELKKIYLQKKIEGRELKNNLLKRLLSDSQSHNKPNEFRMIKIDQPNITN